jgi:manganese/zinc/iron transport system permease protein
MLTALPDALFAYNTVLVAVGAALLGIAAAAVGTSILLRKRSLVSDAVSHATLPGVCIAFLVMVAMGGDGRFLPGLLVGAALSAGLGLLAVDHMTRTTRLTEDAAIGAVLSAFFGFGVVLLTVIQSLSVGRQAGLGGFLLGSTAGMLWNDALLIAVSAALCCAAVFVLRRPLTVVGFDPDYAAASGYDVRAIDLAMMGLGLLVAVIGLKLVGLVLIIALMIIPPVAARFWTERSDRMTLIACVIGGLSSITGAGLSAVFANMPTGPVIVLVSFFIFVLSMLLSPVRGAMAALLRYRRFQKRVHERQGLLSLARGEAIFDRMTLKVLADADLIRRDGVATSAGQAAARAAVTDEARWSLLRTKHPEHLASGRYDGLTPISDVLAADEVAALDRELAATPGAR